MPISYISRPHACIKWGDPKGGTVTLRANDAIQVDGFRLFALPVLPPLPINVSLFDGDLRALAAAQPALAAHSGQLAPRPHGVSPGVAQQALPRLPSPSPGNHVDVAIVDIATMSAHSAGRYFHFGEGNSEADNEIGTTAQSRFYQG